MSKPCSQCGRCCLMLGAEITATQEDVARWVKEGRQDILRYADVYENLGADLWFSPKTGDEIGRCPFVRKHPNRNTYFCKIYDTRPQVCRDYEPFSGEHNDVCEDR
jgi:Fe-S-cluster containining protein